LDGVDKHTYLDNPRALTRWQADKTAYMQQLSRYVNVPYTIVVRSIDVDLPTDFPNYHEAAAVLGCEDLIIKPAQGNGGAGVKLINVTNTNFYDERMYLYLKHYKEDMLIQCFMYSVAHDGPGEINLYVIDGNITHAGYSTPAKDHYLIHEEYGGGGDIFEPTVEQVEYAMNVYNAVTAITNTKPLYMRVDVMYDNDGNLTLMEIASGTTDMWFRHSPQSGKIMAQAIDRRLAEKEALYEQAYGKKAELISKEEFYNLEATETFGSKLVGGNYGKDQLWKKDPNWRGTKKHVPKQTAPPSTVLQNMGSVL
jgi:glutathione synthase/RimK-type ligase-like ATP-grasp enzyme